MRVSELKALVRERGLRGYSWLRKAEIIELIRNNQQGLASWAPDISPRNGTTRPPRPTWPNQTQLVRFRPDRPRQPRQPPSSGGAEAPSPQKMDIFEQQEMSKSRPQVKSKRNDWYD